MQIISCEGIVTLSRGDTFQAPIFINAGNDLSPLRYVLDEGDKLYVGIMEPNQPFETAIIRKVLTAKDLNEKKDAVLTLTPEDTEKLLPGKYYYSVKLQKANGVVNTVIPERIWYIIN